MPGEEGNIKVAIKKGRTDGGAEIGKFYFASELENKIYVRNYSRYQNANVKFFSKE
jgi:hypothetical protein